MASDEISFVDLVGLVRRSQKRIAVLALLFGLAAFVYFWFFVPPVFTSTAMLVARVKPEGPFGVDIYRSLVESGGVLQAVSDRLIGEGVLEEDETVRLGEDVVLQESGPDISEHLLQLTGIGKTPEKAAALANTWAAVTLENVRGMLPTPAQDSETLLEGELVNIRSTLEELVDKKNEFLNDYAKREEDLSTHWDERIAAKQRSIEQAGAAYKVETRRRMEGLMSPLASGPSAGDSLGSGEFATKLSEVVTLRAQLAQTPRVLKLEKAASDETVLDLLARNVNVGDADNTLVTQEINPLYDQLAVRALELESDLKRMAASRLQTVSELLVNLEKMQWERGAGFAALRDGGLVDLKILRRRRAEAIEELVRERASTLAQMDRRQSELANLEGLLSARFNTARVGVTLSELDTIDIVAPAVLNSVPRPKGVLLRVLVATIVGAVLGLVLALFRSVT